METVDVKNTKLVISRFVLYVKDNQEQLILQSENLEIRLEASHKILLTEWRGWLTTSIGKSGCLQILDQVVKYGTTKVLNNNSKVTGHSGDTGWLSDVWLPALREAGVTHFAWVYSRNFFTQLEIDNAVDKSSGIAMRTFFLAEDACQWLLAP